MIDNCIRHDVIPRFIHVQSVLQIFVAIFLVGHLGDKVTLVTFPHFVDKF